MAELLTESTDASTEVKGDAHTQLDETELVDFVKNRGQWPTTLVSENKLNLADVLNPKVEAAAPVKGAKPVGKAPVAADKVNHGGPVRRPKELQLQASRVTLANYRRLGTICVADLDPSQLIRSYQGCGSEFIFC